MKIYAKFLLLPIIIVWCLFSTACQEKLSVQDELMKQGVWYDEDQRLYWDRCSVGQRWNGETCQGSATPMSWAEILDYVKYANKQDNGVRTDWRLPTIAELRTLSYCSDGIQQSDDYHEFTTKSCNNTSQVPTINQQIFPNTAKGIYASSSGEGYLLEVVNFKFGTDSSYNVYDVNFYVRLVHSGVTDKPTK